MPRLLFVLLLVSLLPACALSPGMSALRPLPFLPSVSPAATFSFDWQLSGSRAVAPLQVFDDGRRTWLQFNHGQAIPAIFERTSAGDRPVHYRREGAYLVLPGVWPELVLRGGHLQSHIRRKGGVPVAAQGVSDAVVPAAAGGALPEPDAPQAIAPSSATPSVRAAASAHAAPPTGSAASTLAHPPAPAHGLATALTAASFPALNAEATPTYSVNPSDTNMRLALARWAQLAGWVFAPEHWAVDVDIPLTASAVFEPDFKTAVQELVAATELADRPLQPCFYSNKVLRIVPYAQACDRNASPVRAS
ncbi:TcpQ domain-containing protein [Allopusillimonas ginsengisoli]|uniref:TcpQ domain-containing protein n=1 Tax=Allopusillimonas ginsengisoli TaxID=453575 RepID=UPI0010208A83|nr:TcpQ domain-containing protein [Allopusillimonas ginsengisoli]TEA77345.1 hypothetical protein ERE07_15475 [Allopusillimonas ginsengisoli]